MKKNTKLWIGAGAAALAGTLFLNSRKQAYAPLETVPEVDLEQYEGRWYEIARLPQRFEKGCHCVYAEYSQHPDGYVEVRNACREGGPDGKLDIATGKAFPVEGSHNSKLKVQFFWPFKGDYWILELASDYKYALVGTPDRKSLWILSRTPQLSEDVYERYVQLAAKKDFPVEKLIKTDQSCFAS
ncbi:lipocalin family protein [Pontibacter akesuensis]|uniref:Apolipoprotein D and lipocalin family protein n=1 Tax=Pontibacter akesuensis TaxID=388950 RepID=A0A1I7IFP6_9BACT|nr:lipocalin family protein [Pontibacter akesuensis]GHA66970.1 membrane protein [Pontibacter akesuensis]SFU71722.1 apolipoprotein D and lipocalin family protein [Pontibacter akesuensis]